MLSYRLLTDKEWDKLYPLADNLDGPIPGPDSSVVAVAEEEDGTLVGALFLQIQLHMEPMVIDPSSKGVVNFLKLRETLESDGDLTHVPYFVFSEDSRIGKMCKLGGLKQLPYRVWFKEPTPLPVEEAS